MSLTIPLWEHSHHNHPSWILYRRTLRGFFKKIEIAAYVSLLCLKKRIKTDIQQGFCFLILALTGNFSLFFASIQVADTFSFFFFFLILKVSWRRWQYQRCSSKHILNFPLLSQCLIIMIYTKYPEYKNVFQV